MPLPDCAIAHRTATISRETETPRSLLAVTRRGDAAAFRARRPRDQEVIKPNIRTPPDNDRLVGTYQARRWCRLSLINRVKWRVTPFPRIANPPPNPPDQELRRISRQRRPACLQKIPLPPAPLKLIRGHSVIHRCTFASF